MHATQNSKKQAHGTLIISVDNDDVLARVNEHLDAANVSLLSRMIIISIVKSKIYGRY